MPDININQLVKWNEYIPKNVIPFANQLLFLRSNELEVLYGGAARGGKSVAMLMAALQYMDKPDYNALIVRKTHAELAKGDGLVPLSKKWLMNIKGIRWDDKLFQWEFPNGSILSFGYLQNDNDVYNYQGLSFQFIGFDELTQHPQENYSYLFSRLVSTLEQKKEGIPLRMRATSNPGGVYGQWVYDRFINRINKPNVRDEVISNICVEKHIKTKDVPEMEIRYRMPKFIPSKLFDNPYIDQESYVSNLMKLDVVRREQLMNGNWDIRTIGNMFRRQWFEIINPRKIDFDSLRCVRYWDLAATADASADFTATCKMGFDPKSKYFYILDMALMKENPAEVEAEVLKKSKEDGIRCYTVMEQEPGSSGKNNTDNYKRKVIPPGYLFASDRVTGSKEDRARPLSAAVGNGLVKIVDYPRRNVWYDTVMGQLEAFPEGINDDAVDCSSGCYNFLSSWIRSSARYVGKLEITEPENENTALPEYMQNAKGRNVVSILTGGRPQDAFFRRP
jgi:predicted phage terminase large subunit-like protein